MSWCMWKWLDLLKIRLFLYSLSPSIASFNWCSNHPFQTSSSPGLSLESSGLADHTLLPCTCWPQAPLGLFVSQDFPILPQRPVPVITPSTSLFLVTSQYLAHPSWGFLLTIGSLNKYLDSVTGFKVLSQTFSPLILTTALQGTQGSYYHPSFTTKEPRVHRG